MWRSGNTKTTQIGFINRNLQEVLGTCGVKGNDHGQYSYKMICQKNECGHIYGANGSDIFQRKCPKCDNGKEGIEYLGSPSIDEQHVKLNTAQLKAKKKESCSICGCLVHRSGDYATPTIKGRSHATKHHFVAERFFGRSSNRRGEIRIPIFHTCPWEHEKETAVYCYECHEELLHNPVLLPEDLEKFKQLVTSLGFSEKLKGDSREMLGERIKLFHKVIRAGLDQVYKEVGGDK